MRFSEVLGHPRPLEILRRALASGRIHHAWLFHGAEGVGKDVEMIVGNGYVPGHADLTLELLRAEPKLRKHFEERYAG